MSTPFSAAEAQAARDYAAANAEKISTATTSAAASLARALSSAATAIAGDISLVAEGIEAAGDEQQQQQQRVLRRPERATTTEGTEVRGEGDQAERPSGAAKKKTEPRAAKRASSATRDQLSFLVGVLVFGMSAFYLGAFPVSFSRCYIFLAAVLLGTRFFIYRSTKQHLFLLDLCYQVNALWVVHLVLLPRSLFLRRCLFALSSGPLMGSIGGERVFFFVGGGFGGRERERERGERTEAREKRGEREERRERRERQHSRSKKKNRSKPFSPHSSAFRNSLVFHDLDKMTSLFIHLWPAALAWQSRWHQAPAVAPTLAASAAERPGCCA